MKRFSWGKRKIYNACFCVWTLFFSMVFFSSIAEAGESFETHHNARRYGMGGAYISVVEDEDALFFNPAAIARNTGIYWTIADLGVGASDISESIDAFSDLSDDSTFESALNDLYGEPLWLGATGKTSVMLPFFAFAYFYDVDVSFMANNPVAPTLEGNYITDTGFALGSGWSIAKIFEMGFAAKYITRTGNRETFGAGTIANIVSGTDSTDAIFDSFDASGVGYALDFGANLTIPTPVRPTFSFVWKNMGNTKFRADDDELTPPRIDQEMTIGGSLFISLPLVHIVPALEFRHLESSELDLGQKLHLGLELGLPLVDVRAGLYQGYLSYGAGLGLGLARIDFASWGAEIGGYPGQIESRRYMLQLSIRLGFDVGIGGSAASSSSASRGGSSNSGGSFSRKRPKMRR